MSVRRCVSVTDDTLLGVFKQTFTLKNNGRLGSPGSCTRVMALQVNENGGGCLEIT